MRLLGDYRTREATRAVSACSNEAASGLATPKKMIATFRPALVSGTMSAVTGTVPCGVVATRPAGRRSSGRRRARRQAGRSEITRAEFGFMIAFRKISPKHPGSCATRNAGVALLRHRRRLEDAGRGGDERAVGPTVVRAVVLPGLDRGRTGPGCRSSSVGLESPFCAGVAFHPAGKSERRSEAARALAWSAFVCFSCGSPWAASAAPTKTAAQPTTANRPARLTGRSSQTGRSAKLFGLHVLRPGGEPWPDRALAGAARDRELVLGVPDALLELPAVGVRLARLDPRELGLRRLELGLRAVGGRSRRRRRRRRRARARGPARP